MSTLGAREWEEMGAKKDRHVAKATIRMKSPGALELLRLRGRGLSWYSWVGGGLPSGRRAVERRLSAAGQNGEGRAEVDDADVAKAIVACRLTVVGPTYGQAIWLDRSWLPSTTSVNINHLRKQVVARGLHPLNDTLQLRNAIC